MKHLLLILIISISLNSFASDTTFVTLQVGAGSKFAPINVVDKVTGNYVAATITNVAVQNNNPEFATVIPNPTNQNVIKATAITAGKGAATVSCNVTYVDAGDGLQKNENKIIVISYTVVGAPNGTKLSIVF
jgi:hypothetical protein